MNNSTSSHCPEFSRKIATDIFIIKTTLWPLGILLSLIMIAIVVIAKRLRSSLLYRLLIYLMSASILQGVCQILEQLPVEITEDEQVGLKNGSGWRAVCKSFAYMDMVTTWMSNFLFIWILLLMLWYYYRLVHGGSSVQAVNRTFYVREGIGVLLSVMCPFLISCIPFIKDMYGISGPWCWMMMIVLIVICKSSVLASF